MHLTQYYYTQFDQVTIPATWKIVVLVGDEDGPELMVFDEPANEPEYNA